MKQAFRLCVVLLVFTGCASNMQPPLQRIPAQPATAITATPEEPTWNVYDPDPNHIWNRVFRQFYERTANDGTKYGLGELDPLLWFDTTYLLNGPSHEQALAVLDEFLETDSQNLIRDPLKRAMFQRDLWAVFDWLTFQSDPSPSQRQALQQRLAKIIQRLALSRQEILSLPDSYALAINSNAFPDGYDPAHPGAAFLAPDLFRKDSAWVPMGRAAGPIAMAHTQGFPFLGRSVFLVFVRSPESRAATLHFIDSLNSVPDPVLATGSEVALVRRMLLIDDHGDLILSPLIETIQIRHFKPQQVFHEFELDRERLLNGNTNPFRLNTDVIPLFFSHGDAFETRELPGLQIAIPDLCKGCHLEDPSLSGSGNMESILSYSRARFPLPDSQRPVLSATGWEDETKKVIAWKQNHPSWRALEVLQETREKGAPSGVPFSLLTSVAYQNTDSSPAIFTTGKSCLDICFRRPRNYEFSKHDIIMVLMVAPLELVLDHMAAP